MFHYSIVQYSIPFCSIFHCIIPFCSIFQLFFFIIPLFTVWFQFAQYFTIWFHFVQNFIILEQDSVRKICCSILFTQFCSMTRTCEQCCSIVDIYIPWFKNANNVLPLWFDLTCFKYLNKFVRFRKISYSCVLFCKCANTFVSFCSVCYIIYQDSSILTNFFHFVQFHPILCWLKREQFCSICDNFVQWFKHTHNFSQ